MGRLNTQLRLGFFINSMLTSQLVTIQVHSFLCGLRDCELLSFIRWVNWIEFIRHANIEGQSEKLIGAPHEINNVTKLLNELALTTTKNSQLEVRRIDYESEKYEIVSEMNIKWITFYLFFYKNWYLRLTFLAYR